MSTIVIADCGSTSVDWAVLNQGSVTYYHSPGFNASQATPEQIRHCLDNLPFDLADAQEIKFYGAGCRPGQSSDTVKRILQLISPKATITVNSDLYLAIDATAPCSEAIVAILGTGANSCRVADGKVMRSVRSAGYILGDHGSGAALGRELLGLYVTGQLSAPLSHALEKECSANPDIIIEKIYHEPRANTYLGSFAPFILRHISSEEIHAIVASQMHRFVETNIKPLLSDSTVECNFVGSIAEIFRPQLLEAINGIAPVANITSDPLSLLVNRIIS